MAKYNRPTLSILALTEACLVALFHALLRCSAVVPPLFPKVIRDGSDVSSIFGTTVEQQACIQFSLCYIEALSPLHGNPRVVIVIVTLLRMLSVQQLRDGGNALSTLT